MRNSNSALLQWSGLLSAGVLVVSSGCATTGGGKTGTSTDQGAGTPVATKNNGGNGKNNSGTYNGTPGTAPYGVGPDGKPLPPPPPPEPTPAERVTAGQKALGEKNWVAARDEFAKALEKEPKNFEAILGTAKAYELAGDTAKALEAYEKVLAEQPAHEATVLKLSEGYKRTEKYDQAIELLSKALTANPDNVRVANNLGVTYRLAKKYSEAEATLRKVLQRAPGNADAYKNMAVLFLDQDKLALAEQFSVEARKMDEKDSGVWNNLGLIYFKRDAGKPSRALAAFKKATELNPNEVAAWQNIGAISLRYRDFASAEKAFQKAVEIDPASYANHLSLAYAFDGAKKFEDAVREYDKAVELKGGEICEVHFLKGWIFQQQQKWAETKDLYTKYSACAETDPSKTPARMEKVSAGIKSADYMINLANKQGSQPMAKPPEPEAPKPAPAPAPEAPKAEAAPTTPEGAEKTAPAGENKPAGEEKAPSAGAQ